MKTVRVFLVWFLLLASLLVWFQPVLAQTPEEKPKEKLELTTTYTTLEATSGSSFEFEVKVAYSGGPPRTFTLNASGPKDWAFYITPSYPKDKRIKDVRIDPERGGSESVLVNAATPFWLRPDPGEYTVTLEASAGDLKSSLPLKAVVTARYSLGLSPPPNTPYSTKVTGGEETVYSIEIKNDGTAAVNDISLSADKPEGWTVSFSPGNVDAVQPGKSQTIDAKIKPSAKAIAGDYVVTLRANGKQASADKMDVRVTVETPTVWGWTGVAIVVVVIGGLAFIILRFSRR